MSLSLAFTGLIGYVSFYVVLDVMQILPTLFVDVLIVNPASNSLVDPVLCFYFSHLFFLHAFTITIIRL